MESRLQRRQLLLRNHMPMRRCLGNPHQRQRIAVTLAQTGRVQHAQPMHRIGLALVRRLREEVHGR